jgi:nucleoside-diphosphate-sugar epimerase
MGADVFLVTGATGCIGAWILRNLVAQGERCIATDLNITPTRPRLIMTPAMLDKITFVQADITDPDALKTMVKEYAVTRVIHVAALQIPFCRSNPRLGARVNVEGMVNVLDAVRAAGEQVKGLAYASSVAALGPDSCYPVRPVKDDVVLYPQTLYGVYKQANESTARVYWQDWQVASIGLRPYTAFGVARDQGVTSDLTKAILAAVVGRPYHIRFGGVVAVQYNDDLARMFIECARAGYRGAAVCNVRNDVVSVGEFVKLVQAEAPGAQITFDGSKPLPFPADLDDSGLRGIIGRVPHTPLAAAVHETAGMFRQLLVEERIDLAQLNN